MMSEKITCGLAANALDHLLFAGTLAKKGTPRSLKHAVANLSDGMELLLKARLEITDWKLLFPDPSQADRKRYKTGDFESIKYGEAVKRLKKTCGVRITKGQKKVIDRVRSYRNMIRHHAIRADYAVVVSIITRTYSFAIDFITSEIEGKAKLRADRYVERLRSLLGKFVEFVEERMKVVGPQVTSLSNGLVVECPTCLQPAMYADGERSLCGFCGKNGDGEEMAVEWAVKNQGWRSPKDELIDPYAETCPECGAEACVKVEKDEEYPALFHCFSCGEGGNYRQCCDCNQLFAELTGPDADDEDSHTSDDRCPDCWTDLFARND
jgi:hypothetical protein